MRNARTAKKWHKKHPCAKAWRLYLETLTAKGKAFMKAKVVQYRQAGTEAARKRNQI